jgi:peptidyl-prolyl cis-trans isomerase SurA
VDPGGSKLIAGTVDFGSAVNKYSDDESSKFTAGMMQGQNGSFLTIDQLDQGLVAMLKNLKVGEFSQPVEYTDERGKKGVRLLFLKSRSEPHRMNLKDDYDKIANYALEQKKSTALEKWLTTRIPSYYIMVDNSGSAKCDQLEKWTTPSTASF